MNCVLIDDEIPALELLEDNVKQIPYLNMIAACRNPLHALDIIKDTKIDLIFLDIQMPGLNGLEFLRSIKHPPLVILITAYAEHALDGFDLDVVDYLLKPVPFSRFLKATQKAREIFQMRITQQPNAVPPGDYVFINANYALVKVKIQDITFIEGLKDYVKINMADGKPVITRMGLKGIEEKLSSVRFMRVHKSYIIALDKIESVRKTHLMIGGTELPIGEGYRDNLQNYVNLKTYK